MLLGWLVMDRHQERLNRVSDRFDEEVKSWKWFMKVRGKYG